MKTALLIPWENSKTGETGYTWETPSGQSLSRDFATAGEALQYKPAGFICCDDGYNRI